MKKRKVSVLQQVLVHGFLILASIITATPFFWMISTSFKTPQEIYTLPPKFIPSELTLKNYINLFKGVNFGRPLLNTIIIVLIAPPLGILLNSMAGYAFSKFKFRGRDTLILLILATMMIPGQMTLIPAYLVVRFLNMLNTYRGIIIPGLVGAGSIFFWRQFIKGIPNEIIESAKIDGANELHIYFKIILPLSTPFLITSFVFAFIGAWNSFLWPLIVATDERMYTLPVAVSIIAGQYGENIGTILAGSTIVVFPILIISMIAQRYVIRGIAMTGLKF
ncbi:MAG: carbohydrate ABC transporter permease [Dictyoglomaceae bacterium]